MYILHIYNGTLSSHNMNEISLFTATFAKWISQRKTNTVYQSPLYVESVNKQINKYQAHRKKNKLLIAKGWSLSRRNGLPLPFLWTTNVACLWQSLLCSSPGLIIHSSSFQDLWCPNFYTTPNLENEWYNHPTHRCKEELTPSPRSVAQIMSPLLQNSGFNEKK